MSLSTAKDKFRDELRELADRAYFRRCVLVAAAHNMPVQSYPVALRVGDLGGQPRRGRPDDLSTTTRLRRSISTPAGSGCPSPGRAGGRSAAPATASPLRTSPRISALILSKHPMLTPFQLKSVLYLAARNVARPAPVEAPMSVSESSADQAHAPTAADLSQRQASAVHRGDRAQRLRRGCRVGVPGRPGAPVTWSSRPSAGRARMISSARRFPGGTGIAGWVASDGQPLLVDDSSTAPQFARGRGRVHRLRPAQHHGRAADRGRRMPRRPGGARPGHPPAR